MMEVRRVWVMYTANTHKIVSAKILFEYFWDTFIP